MMRFAVMFFLIWAASLQTAWAQDEIGYVEDFTGAPSNYVVKHGTGTVPMRIFLPVYSGDLIEAVDDQSEATLRLMGHPEPIMWSRGDKDRPLSAEVPKASYWSSLLTSTLGAISFLDNEKRERVFTAFAVAAEIFGVPLLQAPQTMAAGQRKVAVGWLKSGAVTEISITSQGGQLLVDKSKGLGGLWSSPALNLKPGQYRIAVSAGTDVISGNVDVIDLGKMPPIPAELTQDGIPDALRHTAQAVWLAEQEGGRYRLEALQLVVNDKNRSANELVDALIAGKALEAPK